MRCCLNRGDGAFFCRYGITSRNGKFYSGELLYTCFGLLLSRVWCVIFMFCGFWCICSGGYNMRARGVGVIIAWGDAFWCKRGGGGQII